MRLKTTLIALTLGGALLSSPLTAQTIPTQAANPALKALLNSSPAASVNQQAHGALLITGLGVQANGQDTAARAQDVLARYGAAFGVEASQLRLAQVRAAAGQEVALFEQVHGQIKVVDRSLSLTFDAQGKLLTVNHNIASIKAALPAQLDAQAAGAIALKHLHGDRVEVPLATSANKLIVAPVDGGQAFEAWLIALPPTLKALQPRVMVHGTTGQVIAAYDAAKR